MAIAQGSWHVGRAAGQCAHCGVQLPPGAVCWAALCDRPLADGLSPAEKKDVKETDAAELSPFVRVDFCEACWNAGKRPESLAGEAALAMFSFWKTIIPAAQQKKKLLVDDAVLVDVFSRMEGKNEPQEVRFRFVLGLILMRKRLLRYEGMEEAPAGGGGQGAAAPGGAAAPELWRMIPRGAPDQIVHVINPHLTAEQITEVSGQLSAILAEEV